jgi:hypothetical protein
VLHDAVLEIRGKALVQPEIPPRGVAHERNLLSCQRYKTRMSNY